MIFRNRADAGRQLSSRFQSLAGRGDVTVLGIPRGGVAVAFELAQALHVALDIFLSRKLGVPGQEELAFGALDFQGHRYLDEQIIRNENITPEQINLITANAMHTLSAQAATWRGNLPPLKLTGRTVLLVDDGIATGASVSPAIEAIRQMNPAKLILAIPVVPPSTCSRLQSSVHQVVCLCKPLNFHAVGQFYSDFSPVTDGEVLDLLRNGTSVQHPST